MLTVGLGLAGGCVVVPAAPRLTRADDREADRRDVALRQQLRKLIEPVQPSGAEPHDDQDVIGLARERQGIDGGESITT